MVNLKIATLIGMNAIGIAIFFCQNLINGNKNMINPHNHSGTLLIKNLRLYDGLSDEARPASILSHDGVIQRISTDIPEPKDAKIYNGEGLCACYGFIDLHVHLRDPGQTHKENIAGGTASAAAGGYGTVLCMPNTVPAADNPKIISYIIDEAEKTGSCRVHPVGAITEGLEGKRLTDFASLKKAGAIALSDDGRPVESAALMLEALKKAAGLDMLVISHCEELSLINYGSAAEDTITARDIILAGSAGARLHIAHVSSAGAADLIGFGKKTNPLLSAETCPHYFSLTDEAVHTVGVNAKMNPPLRSKRDREAITEALRDGTIDCIATDHAPHTAEDKFEKENDMEKAANGIIGLESAFSLGITHLVKPGILSLTELIKLYTVNPAKIARLDIGTVKEGAATDITLFDPDERFIFDRNSLRSKSKNTPFHGMEMFGKIKYKF